MTRSAMLMLVMGISTALLAIMFAAAYRALQPPPVDTADAARTQWFHDAKFGIFMHWGLYTVPAYAPRSVSESFHSDMDVFFKENPYAEWYWNSMRMPGSPTQQFHEDTYRGKTYRDFVPMFEDESRKWNASALAEQFASFGARYVVQVTKHHDGYVMYNTSVPHPDLQYRNWHTTRDFVGEMAAAVRARGLRFGVYYSGGPDWSINTEVVTSPASMLRSIPQSPEYVAYITQHWRELIARYRPAVLWNDIGAPELLDRAQLFAHYTDLVPDGLMNDRFTAIHPPSTAWPALSDSIINWLAKYATQPDSLLSRYMRASGLKGCCYSFETPEFTGMTHTTPYKWETCRGLGFGFGYNRIETADDVMTLAQLVGLLVDVVSKNGNLLLNPAITADGRIPESQATVLRGLGQWLGAHGEAIYGTSSCQHSDFSSNYADGYTSLGQIVRFTCKYDAAANRTSLYVIVVVGGSRQSVSRLPPQLHLKHPRVQLRDGVDHKTVDLIRLGGAQEGLHSHTTAVPLHWSFEKSQEGVRKNGGAHHLTWSTGCAAPETSNRNANLPNANHAASINSCEPDASPALVFAFTMRGTEIPFQFVRF